MTWLALALALTVAAPAGPAAPGGRDALGALADGVTSRLGSPEEGRRGLALALTAEPAALAAPLSAALAGALGQAGWAVSPVPPGPGAEAAARAAGADWLLTLTAGGGPDGRELVAVGEAVSLWSSFFLQARPGVRAAPPRLVSARAAADAAARLLLKGAGPAAPPTLSLRRLALLPTEVVALAAGEVEGLGPVLLAIGGEGRRAAGGVVVRLLDRRASELAARSLDGAARRPTRHLAATAVVAPLGGGPFGVALAGAGGGEVLVRRGARLERAAALPLAPLAAGGAGVLFGAFAPGKAALQDLLTVGVDPATRPRSALDLVAVAAAPHGSTPAFGVLHPGGRLELLGGALAPAGEVADVGTGFALADLDGDGRSELVASRTGPGSPDGVRVLRLDAGPRPASTQTATAMWESPPIPGAVLSAAAWDLTGDGLDDVVLAAVQPGPDGVAGTELWLVTLDPREAP
jgi:hypothetical protein